MNVPAALFIFVLLAVPVLVLFGVLAGTLIGYRLARGLAPVKLPDFGGKKIVTQPQEKQAERRLPSVSA